MSERPIILPRFLVNKLLHQAQILRDYEVCGLIGAVSDVPQSVYPISNVAPDPRRHFLMDPREQIQAMKTMRRRGETLFSIYHSHPSAPALPSREDLEQVAYPEALTLIISLKTKGVLELRAFRLDGNRPEEIAVEMDER